MGEADLSSFSICLLSTQLHFSSQRCSGVSQCPVGLLCLVLSRLRQAREATTRLFSVVQEHMWRQNANHRHRADSSAWPLPWPPLPARKLANHTACALPAA